MFARGFETGMAEFQKNRRADVPAFLREMSAYFAKFEPGPSNLYCDVMRILRESKRPFTIATLNYDLLIERAITIAGYRVAYHAPPVPARNTPVLKLHGSCNFLPDLRGLSIHDVAFDLPGPDDVNVVGNIRAAQPDEVVRYCEQEDSLAPAVALYAAGKQILFCPAFVRQQQQDWSRIVATAARIYIVGVRLSRFDRHVWDPLEATRAKLFYVDPNGEDFLSWAAETRGRASFHLAPVFEDLPSILHSHLAA
jgi:hypothetical protein